MSGAASRNKGARAERAVATWLRAHGHPTAARRLDRHADTHRQQGDITGIAGLCLEVKDQATYDIPAWLRQAVEEAGPGELAVLIVHPRGVADVGDWWAICRLRDLIPAVAA